MRIIFLDFDGVLNSHAWFVQGGRSMHDVDPACVRRINTITERTGAHVVVSSTWRLGRTLDELRSILAKHGYNGKVIGVTPDLSGRTTGLHVAVERGHEIQKWMDDRAREDARFGVVESFVIIDDDSDMAHLKPRLVQTTFATGITDLQVERAIALLKDPYLRQTR